MIALARTICSPEDRFLEILPQLQQQAHFAFRDEPASRCQELVAETIANCWVAFARLVERGLIDVVYPTPLVQYAIRQVRDGRRVGSKLNSKDVSSGVCPAPPRFLLEALDKYNQRRQEWKEVLVEDKHAGPAETAASRIDFADWLRMLPEAFAPYRRDAGHRRNDQEGGQTVSRYAGQDQPAAAGAAGRTGRTFRASLRSPDRCRSPAPFSAPSARAAARSAQTRSTGAPAVGAS